MLADIHELQNNGMHGNSRVWRHIVFFKKKVIRLINRNKYVLHIQKQIWMNKFKQSTYQLSYKINTKLIT